ncbi:MAG TPA: PfkB family carbohydrate kinase [Spirochaetia bacterium]|nr:PfkB family carbohydrate kinase [Spirochaetia bacterium]
MKLSPAQLDTVFSALRQARIAVIGDFCLDLYLFLDDSGSELSVETGLRTNAVRSLRLTPGGAGNVVANLAAMGAAEVHAFGIRGDDLFGREYVRILNGLGVKTDGFLVQQSGWTTCAYTKLYNEDREQPRIDLGNFNSLQPDACEALLSGIRAACSHTDLFLVNQQLVRGIHTPDFRAGLTEIVRSNPEKIFILDSRDFVDAYDGMLRKLNDHEAARAAGFSAEDRSYRRIETLEKIARILFQRWRQPIVITRGDRGSVVFDGRELHAVPGLHLTRRIDTVGAGDSVFAGIASAIAAKMDLSAALLFASIVAGVTIQKLFQTGTASETEIRTLAADVEYRIDPELAESPERATFWKKSECEIVRPVGNPGFQYVIFDHDGTISTLREGWETVMEPVMMESIFGDSPASADDRLRKEVSAEVREFIDKTTGVQTLVQMAGLADLVRERGFVPKEKILDAAGYKRRYLERLNLLVADRIAKLENGQLSPSDFTIKGAVGFLTGLRERGLRLYLASGTDEADARREAHLLGYGELFDGGIYGAKGDVRVEPKRVVLETILDEIGSQNGARIVTFGDGPVEIRETWKRDGIGIGIASNEVRRFGLNLTKRTRLVLAGAAVIVPDFSQADVLEALLFGGRHSDDERSEL